MFQNNILQPAEVAILNGVVYIGEDEAETYPKGRKPDFYGEIFDSKTACLGIDELTYSEATTLHGPLMLIGARLGWEDSSKITFRTNGRSVIAEYAGGTSYILPEDEATITHDAEYVCVTPCTERKGDPCVFSTEEFAKDFCDKCKGYRRISEKGKDVTLFDAKPECDHIVICASGGGIRCVKCPGWFCF